MTTDFLKLLELLHDNNVEFITLPALIKAKEAMGRPKDKEAVLILATLMGNDN